MSKQLIQQYRANVERLIQYGGSRNEMVLRKAFLELLDHYARSKNLLMVPEVEHTTRRGHKVYPDGTLKDALRQDWGFWESKDEKDNLQDEIASKFAKGYPDFNILFEDTHTAVLYQNGGLVLTASFDDDVLLDEILTLFVSYEPAEVREFHKAIEKFSADVPDLAKALREIIDEQFQQNQEFNKSLCEFLELCRQAINPKVEMPDVREMVIQHILTEDIFMRVFDEVDFHRDNIIARNLQEIAGTFYKGNVKRSIDARIAPYYETINARASQISDHHEKQKFLKALYENFYKAYNPKAADRLGVIYTPDEIVHFMIESTDYLLSKHFGKTIGDPYVEILDPATGTGTFVTELIEYLPNNQLDLKYENEIHCNEVAILPYYIANLNIEFTYKQKTGKYKEFENICFVDTLDNMGFSRTDEHQIDMFGLWDENAERIGRQNSRKISVIIGNPPYNANQMNENENNKNREYPEIDKRIKDTYIKNSTAQKTKLYDMYTRFLRWASDRLSNDGIIAFVSNNSFIDARSYDGFRKVITKEFNHLYIINLKGDARTSGERRRKEGGNVFNDQIRVGVAIYFFIRKKGEKDCKIKYKEIDDYGTSESKKVYLRENRFENINFNHVKPDIKYNWINKPNADWQNLLPIASKETKLGQNRLQDKAIFKIYSLGIVTARDEWVYDFYKSNLQAKVNFFVEMYNSEVHRWIDSDKKAPINNFVTRSIKWTSELEEYLRKEILLEYFPEKIRIANYRPFIKSHLYFDRIIIHRPYLQKLIFPNNDSDNLAICMSLGNRNFNVLAVDSMPDYHLNGDSQCFPLYEYSSDGERISNISDFASEKFKKHYIDNAIQKQDIFNYVYSVLHNPAYSTKYFNNLRFEFPRIPFYKDFWKWSEWGKALMDLHLNFETVTPYPLERVDRDPENIRKAITPRLKAHKELGIIEIDTITTLKGVPAEVWNYRLGTYTAIEWILERYKEKNPKDPTIREKFNNYKFADYKEQVIDLISRVCTVSVETMKIIAQMPEE